MPKIKSNSVFSFATSYYDGTIDRPDNSVPPVPAGLSTPLPETTLPGNDDPIQLKPVGNVRAYPGPEHYAGDVLTFEIIHDGSFGDETVPISMTLDDGEPTEISATASWIGMLLPLALDTTNLSGRHTLKFSNSDGRLSETYSFEVLPADQRPANEQSASWQVHETACCVMHSIAGTAAARDIEFIAEHFQQAAQDFSTITGSNIDPKLNVYIIDSMWGKGGFGGNGELVISYFDRYYGPAIGVDGVWQVKP